MAAKVVFGTLISILIVAAFAAEAVSKEITVKNEDHLKQLDTGNVRKDVNAGDQLRVVANPNKEVQMISMRGKELLRNKDPEPGVKTLPETDTEVESGTDSDMGSETDTEVDPNADNKCHGVGCGVDFDDCHLAGCICKHDNNMVYSCEYEICPGVECEDYDNCHLAGCICDHDNFMGYYCTPPNFPVFPVFK